MEGSFHSPRESGSSAPTAIADDMGKLVSLTDQVLSWSKPQAKHESPFAVFVIVGTQSVGKSMVVERFAQFPMNVIKSERATKRPLEVTIVNDLECKPGELICHARESSGATRVKLKHDEVQQWIEKQNESVPTISADKIFLEVKSSGVQTMKIVDLPGLELNGVDGEDESIMKEIKRMISEFAKKDDHYLVVLEKATTQYQTSSIVQFLDKTVKDWKAKAVLALTFADALYRLESENRVEETVKNRKDEYVLNCQCPLFFVTNKPHKSKDFEEKRRALTGMDGEEAKTIKEAFDGASRHTVEELDPSLGFEKLRQEVSKNYRDTCFAAFVKVGGELQECARTKSIELDREQKVLQRIEEEAETSHIESHPHGATISSYSALLEKRMECRKRQDELEEQIKQDDPEDIIDHIKDCFEETAGMYNECIDHGDPSAIFGGGVRRGRTMSEELEEFSKKEFLNNVLRKNISADRANEVKAYDDFFHDLCKHFDAHLEEAPYNLLGGAAYDRARRAWLFSIVHKVASMRSSRAFPEETVLNAMGAGSGVNSIHVQKDPATVRFLIFKYVINVVVEPSALWFFRYGCFILRNAKRASHDQWKKRGTAAALVLANRTDVMSLLDNVDTVLFEELFQNNIEELVKFVSNFASCNIPSLGQKLSPVTSGRFASSTLVNFDDALHSLRILSEFNSSEASIDIDSLSQDSRFQLFVRELLLKFMSVEEVDDIRETMEGDNQAFKAALEKLAQAWAACGNSFDAMLDYDPDRKILNWKDSLPTSPTSTLRGAKGRKGEAKGTSCQGSARRNFVNERKASNVSNPCQSEMYNVGDEETYLNDPTYKLLRDRALERSAGFPETDTTCNYREIIETAFEYVHNMHGMIDVMMTNFFKRILLDGSKKMLQRTRSSEEALCKLLCVNQQKPMRKALNASLIDTLWNSDRDAAKKELLKVKSDAKNTQEDIAVMKRTLAKNQQGHIRKIEDEMCMVRTDCNTLKDKHRDRPEVAAILESVHAALKLTGTAWV